MNSPVYDKSAPKRAVIVSVEAGLVSAAERPKWLTENADAIEAYNRRIEEATILSDAEPAKPLLQIRAIVKLRSPSLKNSE